MIFKDRILGGAQHFQGDPYLNGTTVPFDNNIIKGGPIPVSVLMLIPVLVSMPIPLSDRYR